MAPAEGRRWGWGWGCQAWYNLFHCAGFAGNGVQHSMGIGRAVMEHCHDGAYRYPIAQPPKYNEDLCSL